MMGIDLHAGGYRAPIPDLQASPDPSRIQPGPIQVWRPTCTSPSTRTLSYMVVPSPNPYIAALSLRSVNRSPTETRRWNCSFSDEPNHGETAGQAPTNHRYRPAQGISCHLTFCELQSYQIKRGPSRLDTAHCSIRPSNSLAIAFHRALRRTTLHNRMDAAAHEYRRLDPWLEINLPSRAHRTGD